jgi:hypothetical protein
VPSNAEELRQRVVQLQRLLGEDGAARALLRWPGILGSRYAVMATTLFSHSCLVMLFCHDGGARALQRWPGVLGSRYAVMAIYLHIYAVPTQFRCSI